LRFWLMAAAALAVAFGAACPAGAETDSVRIARQYSLAALPLMVVEKRKLIEKRAIAAGLDQVKVQWQVPDKSGAVDTLLNGNADLAPVSVGHFLAAWDRKLGTPQEMRALAPLVRVPYVLVTRNTAIKTIRDFTDRDRIAVPAIKFSGPALMLEMAAAQEWGPEHYDKLDDRVRSVSNAQASAELRDGKTDLDAHFSRSPFVDPSRDGFLRHRRAAQRRSAGRAREVPAGEPPALRRDLRRAAGRRRDDQQEPGRGGRDLYFARRR
jgi:NitT/TauT family transport system substrate-binding protein